MSYQPVQKQSYTSIPAKEGIAKKQHSAIPIFLLNGLPGIAVWLTFLFCVIGSIFIPKAVLFLVSITSIYMALRFLVATIASQRGLKKITDWEQVDWFHKYQADQSKNKLNWQAIQHIVIVPNYDEPEEVLCRTLQNLAQQENAKTNITIIMAMEEREPDSKQKAQRLQQTFQDNFAKVVVTIHPNNLPDEIPSKSANLAWALQHIRTHLLADFQNESVLITTMDADTLWHPNYFSALTYFFATDPNRYQQIYQAPIQYHANIWQVHPLTRILNAYATGFERAYLSDMWISLPISSYSLSLKLLDSCGGWDRDVIADELHTFIKAYISQQGKTKVQAIYLPFQANATTGKNLFDEILNRYRQTLRHAWGSKELGFAIQQVIVNGLTWKDSLRLILRVSEDIFIMGVGWILINVGMQLPALFHASLRPTSISAVIHNPFWLIIMLSASLVTILGAIVLIQDVRIRPPRQDNASFIEKLLSISSFLFLPFLSLILIGLPVIQAQTMLLFRSNPKEFHVTHKE